MILREFLYVDTDKVRGMLAQLDEGIAVEQRSTTRRIKQTEGGIKGVASHYQNWGDEHYVQKSLGDAIFPALEEALESSGVLVDISDELTDEDNWYLDSFREANSPGSIVRITADGSLFDARYVAVSLAGFTATYSALVDIGAVPIAPSKPSSAKRGHQPNRRIPKPSAETLEALIPDFPPLTDVVTPDFMRAIVKVSRGMFMPGLHLNLMPTDDDRLTIGARLQEGRQFLDSEPEILFARYGTGKQRWTVVGSIGYYAGENDRIAPAGGGFVDDEQHIIRGKTSNYINEIMGFLGGLGFADRLPYPGFSIVPLAVYRTIPRSHAGDVVERS